MDNETTIRLDNVENLIKTLQKHRDRSDRNHLLGCLIIAFGFQLFGSLLGGDLKDYMWNVSAGFYAAGLTYWLIERDHQKRKAELEVADKLATYTHRMMQVAKSSKARHRNIERTQEHLERFQNKIQNLEGREKLKYEYLTWQMQMQLLYEFAVLKQEMSEHIELVQGMRAILVEKQMSDEVARLENVIRALKLELSQVESSEKATGEEVVNKTVDFHERFIGPVEKS
jgi:hypothetical protein